MECSLNLVKNQRESVWEGKAHFAHFNARHCPLASPILLPKPSTSEATTFFPQRKAFGAFNCSSVNVEMHPAGIKVAVNSQCESLNDVSHLCQLARLLSQQAILGFVSRLNPKCSITVSAVVT